MVAGEACGTGVMGMFSAGGTGSPFSLFEELCGCEGVDAAAAEFPLI